MSDEIPPDNVVELRPQPPTVEVVRGGGQCFHKQVTVDEQARKVHCARCGDEMDPFRALLDFAQRMQLEGGWLKRLRTEKRSVATRVEELKREERNAKARLKRAHAKLRVDPVMDAARAVLDATLRVGREGRLPDEMRAPLHRLLKALHEYEGWPQNAEEARE